jgi:hypothetical protein
MATLRLPAALDRHDAFSIIALPPHGEVVLGRQHARVAEGREHVSRHVALTPFWPPCAKPAADGGRRPPGRPAGSR